MNILLVCLIITVCITYIWDYTPFISDIGKMIVKLLTGKTVEYVQLKKPFGCSLCMTTWITLIILLIFAPKLCFMCFVFGWATLHILTMINIIDLIISKLLYVLEKLIKLIK